MDGLLAAIKTLGDALAAYQQRIKDLEATVVAQQQQIADLTQKQGEGHGQ